ncbi:MAG: hypothetical protein NW205_13620 [Hyphomicrobiaceae bacterium]|nr:hypothetical protein [Hyphomicrobiaceae bacterium]
MSRYSPIPADEPASFSFWRLWPLWVAAVSFSICYVIWRSPENSFHPMCTYTVNARMTADVVVAGQTLTSTLVYQNSRSRQWLSTLNSAGCRATHGTAFTFRLADDRVLIVPSRICIAGERILAETGSVDVLTACTGKQALQDSGYLVDSATHPRRWYGVRGGTEYKLVRMTGVSTWDNPADDIATVAPNIMKSDFHYETQSWSTSPERTLSFKRRYAERRHKPDKAYEFTVENQRF